ncbi:type II toxin-antitoxin system death-on-curing family toxin [bacterium]|nr:MAG: type II toxin-antitoxin system death-on-curing family toxin [bacterium]
MKIITPEQVLFIHYRVIETTGGTNGIRDMALLESAVQRPLATFGKKDLYPNIFLKASALMHSLIKNHPFLDGNKRTAITASAVFLKSNGYTLSASNKELERFTITAAKDKTVPEQMAEWFRKNPA